MKLGVAIFNNKIFVVLESTDMYRKEGGQHLALILRSKTTQTHILLEVQQAGSKDGSVQFRKRSN